MSGKVDVLLGLQWGDEGKGKVVDALTPNYDIVARFQGGPNAGHTIKIDWNTQVLHTIPSGIFHYNVENLIGNGVVIEPVILCNEIEQLMWLSINPYENLYISHREHLILPTDRLLDAAYERAKGNDKIGSTLKGIGPTYTDKIARNGLRIGDINMPNFRQKYNNLKKKHIEIAESLGFNTLSFSIDDKTLDEYEISWFEAIESIKKIKIVNGEYWLNDRLAQGKNVLAEGAQGTMLDIDFGTYPFVTSSNTITGGVCTGLGIPPSAIDRVFGVTKAYCTRVGAGPFPTELSDKTGETLRLKGYEFGATTGRPRRCGWLDLVQLRFACMINGVTDLIITKADILNGFKKIKVCSAYDINGTTSKEVTMYIDQARPIYTEMPWTPITPDDLPRETLNFMDMIKDYLNTHIHAISYGPGRDDMITLKEF